MRDTLIIAAALLAAACSASAATLKPFSTLTGPVVRLSDLWDGVANDKPLGPAPSPGGRITVPAAQLAAIARQFDVDWRPNSSGDQAILERAGRALMRDDVLPPLRAALVGAGASPGADIELGAFAAPLFGQDTKLDIAVAQIEFDRISGRFSAQLDVTAAGSPAQPLRVTGRIQDMVDIPVARHRILPGETVAAADLDWAHLPSGLARGEIVHTPAEAIGLSAKQTILPAQPIKAAELGRVTIIRKGGEVALSLETPGISLSARGVAIEPGGVGDRIRVLNEYTRMTVDAVVTAPGQARVLAGTAQPANRTVAFR